MSHAQSSAVHQAGLIQDITLRDAVESDLAIFFQYQLDAVATRMAAFTARDPHDREAYMAKWTRNLADPANVVRTILCGEVIVGSIASFMANWLAPESSPQRHVTYWIDRAHWGNGIATAALQRFLREPCMAERPLYASAARDNLASLRVLQKCGFRIVGYERAFANGRGEEIEEAMLVLTE